MDMAFEEFIENHVRVAQKGEHIKLSPAQLSFVDWLEECKRNGLKPLSINGRKVL